MPVNPDLRSRGIGGSDIAAIVGLDSRRDAFSVWAEKTGRLKRSAPTERMEAGKFLEKAIAQWYAFRTRQHVFWCDETMVNRDRSWHVCTPDALVGFDAACEPWAKGVDCKNVALDQRDKWGEPGTDDVPDHIHLQCQWYCSGLDLPQWDVAACVGGNDLRIYRVRRDSIIEEAMLDEGERFWREHVLADDPPPPGPSPATVDALGQMYPRNLLDVRFASDDEAKLLAELKAANDAFDPVNRRCVEAENRVKAAIGDADGLMRDAWRVTWKKEKDSTGPDWESIARELGLRIALLQGKGVDIPEEWRQTVDDLARKMTHVTRRGARKLHVSWGKSRKNNLQQMSA